MKKAFSSGAEQCRQSQNKSEFNSDLGFYNLGPSSFSKDSPGKPGPSVPSESAAFRARGVFRDHPIQPHLVYK